MRYLNEVDSVVAGFHDGVRARVMDTGMTDALVTQHEAMHARIFRETPDGQVHAAYCLALERNLVAGPDRDAVRASAAAFFGASRTAQESFATYLSVKIFPRSHEPNLISGLTPEYIEYFKSLSKIIDPLTSSTYLQFLMAWNLAVVVFSSPLMERLETLNASEVVTLENDENPDHRLAALLDILESEDLKALTATFQGIANHACDEQGLAPFDIEDDAIWDRLASQNSTRQGAILVEDTLAKTIRTWLREKAPITFIDGQRLSVAFKAFGIRLRQELGLDLKRWAELDSPYSGHDHQIHIEARYASQSRVVNSKYSRIQPGLLGDLGETLLEQAGSISIYSACPPQRTLTHWTLFAWRNRASDDPKLTPFYVAEFERDDVVAFLELWRTRRAAGRASPDLRAVVIALNDARDFTEILRFNAPTLWRHPEISERLCWYWWGAFYDIYDLFSDQSLRTATIYIQAGSRDNTLKSLREFNHNGLSLKIMEFGRDRGRGLFIRALPRHSMIHILAMEQDLIAHRKLDEMPHAMALARTPLAKEALYAAKSLWPEY